MSKDLPTQQNPDEIDLGQIFKLIGNAFDRFYKFIKTIFVNLFHLLMGVLLFVKNHFIKLAIAGALGLGLGYFLDVKTPATYESKMIVEPNFNSVQQLYNNINYYNELAVAQDSIALSSTLELSKAEAASIKEITVSGFTDENQKIKQFNDFIKSLDSLSGTRQLVSYEAYLKNLKQYNSKFHEIVFIATNPNVAVKVQDKIINSIIKNNYFKTQQFVSKKNIELKDAVYKKQLKEVDTLQQLYKNLAIIEAKKQVSGTNISLADKTTSNNEGLALINKLDQIKDQQIDLNNERATKENIINVISNFPSLGVKSNRIFKTNKFMFFISFIGLTLFILILLELNSYLKKYQQSRENV